MAALGFAGCSMPSYDRALHALRSWLDSWSGIGHVAVGMARQGYDLQLTRYDEKGWRATFYTTGMEHSPTSATGTGWERTPWHAVQGAAREALRQGDVMYSGPTFWISVAGRFVHLKCLDARNVRFCQNCSTPVGKCRCGANLRDALEGPSRLSEQAVWCTKCGQKYPFVSPHGCANEIQFS
jgi:hypothetical protein